MAEKTHANFDQKVRCICCSNINQNLQPHKKNTRNIDSCCINRGLLYFYVNRSFTLRAIFHSP